MSYYKNFKWNNDLLTVGTVTYLKEKINNKDYFWDACCHSKHHSKKKSQSFKVLTLRFFSFDYSSKLFDFRLTEIASVIQRISV